MGVNADTRLLGLFARNMSIPHSCLQEHPTIFDNVLAYAINSCNVVQIYLKNTSIFKYDGWASNKEYTNRNAKCTKWARDLNRLRNKELEKKIIEEGYQEAKISRIRSCIISEEELEQRL